MTRPWRPALIIANSMCLLMGALAIPAHAHANYLDYYNTWYENSVDYRFTAGFFGGTAARNRVAGGFNVWNVVEPAAYGTVLNPVDYADFTPTGSCPTFMKNGIHSRASSFFAGVPKPLAITTYCTVAGTPRRMHSAQVVFNAGYVWYTGSSTSVPVDYCDMQSVSAHEAGHFSGSVRSDNGVPGGHFAEANQDDCPETGARQTLCESIYPGGAAGGGSVQRTLESHDTHTFELAQS